MTSSHTYALQPAKPQTLVKCSLYFQIGHSRNNSKKQVPFHFLATITINNVLQDRILYTEVSSGTSGIERAVYRVFVGRGCKDDIRRMNRIMNSKTAEIQLRIRRILFSRQLIVGFFHFVSWFANLLKTFVKEMFLDENLLQI